MKDQINIIREALENSSDLIFKDVTKSHLRAQALTALAHLEAMAKEPAAWGLIDKGETRARGVSTWDKSREAEWTPLYAAPVAQQPQAEAMPPGYVLVPVEPTKEMLLAGSADLRLGDCIGTIVRASECWRAMLAAAKK